MSQQGQYARHQGVIYGFVASGLPVAVDIHLSVQTRSRGEGVFGEGRIGEGIKREGVENNL